MKHKKLIKTILSLSIIVLVSVGLLAFVDSITKDKIAENLVKNYNSNLNSVIPLNMTIGQKFDNTNSDVIKNEKSIDALIVLLDENLEESGYILELRARGYNGNMQVFCSYNLGGKVLNAVLGQNEETAGIGKKAEEDGYMDMFVGSGEDSDVPNSKSMLKAEEADAISGATITFVGISQAIAYGSNFVKNWNFLGQGGESGQ